jgi:hypothetical protein
LVCLAIDLYKSFAVASLKVFAVASLAVIPAGNLLLCSHYSHTAFALNDAEQNKLTPK